MGRAKIAMEFIAKEKARNTTYIKRKKGLIKKAHELSVLCGVPICIITYPYNEGKVPLNPEVYSFKPREEGTKVSSLDTNHLDLARARDPSMAREIIDRYLDASKEDKKKRAINLCDMFDAWNRRAGQELSKLRHINARLKFPTNLDSTMLCGYADQLVQLIAHLDQKLEILRQRIDMIKSNQRALVVPHFEPTPISDFVIPVNYNNSMLADQGDVDVKLMDHFSWFNYPFGDHHQTCHGPGSIDPNGLHDHTMPVGVGQGEGHICYDQSSQMVDNKVANSSDIAAALPMSMPLHITLPFSVSFSWHGMHA